MLSYIIKLLAQMSWLLILSADISAKYTRRENGPDYALDVHSMWFMYLGFPLAPRSATPTIPRALTGMPHQSSSAQPVSQYVLAQETGATLTAPIQYGYMKLKPILA